MKMKNATEIEEGRQTTLQLFLVVKYFLSHVYSKTLFTECSYDNYFRTSTVWMWIWYIIIYQFILPSFYFERDWTNWIERSCHHIIQCVELDVHKQRNGMVCLFIFCYCMYHIMMSRIHSEGVNSFIRYDTDEYHSFLTSSQVSMNEKVVWKK